MWTFNHVREVYEIPVGDGGKTRYPDTVDVEFLGHAAVILHAGEYRLLLDPYESGQFSGRMAYRPIDERVDAVLCTHRHVDHCAVHAVPGSPTTVHEGDAGPFRVRRFTFDHDEYGGRRRGGRVDAVEVSDGTDRVLHLSDVGQAPDPDRIEPMRQPDVLLVPVGGFYTIGAAQAWEWMVRLDPSITIPVHYRTTACTLPIRGIDNFLAWAESFSVHDSCRLSIRNGPRGVVVVPARYA